MRHNKTDPKALGLLLLLYIKDDYHDVIYLKKRYTAIVNTIYIDIYIFITYRDGWQVDISQTS